MKEKDIHGDNYSNARLDELVRQAQKDGFYDNINKEPEQLEFPYYGKIQAPSAYDTQVGGDHYKSFAIQPGTYCYVNKLNNYQSEIISYVSRYDRKWDSKTKKVEDLQKAIHTISLLIEEVMKDGN